MVRVLMPATSDRPYRVRPTAVRPPLPDLAVEARRSRSRGGCHPGHRRGACAAV